MGKFNLDINPPIYTDGEYIQAVSLRGTLDVTGTARLTTWKTSGQPGRVECASAVDADGAKSTYYAKGNQICGRTAEGRTFLLHINSTGNTVRTQVTVWNK
ncbi:hypothetical protein [Amycolatopsis sp. CA-128772]|uniref:hypothetical protein n=1 Tax=Amycolatopsis sp. CA-128772 TaxID=2073159 RepID=UPI000CD303C3|nr:hypothetical protein [Amycolatopsis sp. CA-128772]